MVKWLATYPNPRRPATGVNAGLTGWKLHAVTEEELKFKYPKALCGLVAKYGWGVDFFVEDKCKKCQNKLK